MSHSTSQIFPRNPLVIDIERQLNDGRYRVAINDSKLANQRIEDLALSILHLLSELPAPPIKTPIVVIIKDPVSQSKQRMIVTLLPDQNSVNPNFETMNILVPKSLKEYQRENPELSQSPYQGAQNTGRDVRLLKIKKESLELIESEEPLLLFKSLDKKKPISKKENPITKQIDVLTRLRGIPGVVQLLQSCSYFNSESVKRSCFIVEKHPIDLFYHLKANKISQEEQYKIISGLLNTCCKISDKNIIHRDLKLENILLDKDGKPIIIDFGFSIKDEDPNDFWPIGGTSSYYSPEYAFFLMLYGLRSKESFARNPVAAALARVIKPGIDVYALGATIVRIVDRKHAYCSVIYNLSFEGKQQGNQPLVKFLASLLPKEAQDSLFPEATIPNLQPPPSDFLQQFRPKEHKNPLLSLAFEMLEPNPMQRISFQEALDKFSKIPHPDGD